MAKKPVIAIVFHEKINDYYGDALEQLGGIPIYLQPGKEAFLSPWIDGVMLTGGGDPMASLFGEAKITESAVPDVRRDLFEIQVVRHCVEKNIPLLGICRGMQMINIALGGDIHQDITRCYGSSLEHRQQGNYHIPSHRIRIVEKSHLHRLWNRNSLMVNVIEALEGQGIMAVQYHPERMYPRLEESLLFEDLIKRAKGLL